MKFTFNGVSVIVEGSSNPETIWRDYIRASRGYIGREVGPHPHPRPAGRGFSPERPSWTLRQKQGRQEAQTAAQKAAESKRQEVEAKLALAPAMEITNLRTWEAWVESNQDPYGRRCLALPNAGQNSCNSSSNQGWPSSPSRCPLLTRRTSRESAEPSSASPQEC